MTWEYLRSLGELNSDQREDAAIVTFVRRTMQDVRADLEEIYQELQSRGYQFSDPETAFVRSTSDAESVVAEIESKVGALPLSIRYFWIEVGSVNFCQHEDQLVMWHKPNRESAVDLELLGEEDPLCVVSAPDLLEDLIHAETNRGRGSGIAHYGWRKPHLDRWYCHLACDEFHKANYSGGENYNFFIPDSSADFRIYDLFSGASGDEDADREWFVDHLHMSIAGGGFRGRYTEDDNGYSKPLPESTVAVEIGAKIKNRAEQGGGGQAATRPESK